MCAGCPGLGCARLVPAHCFRQRWARQLSLAVPCRRDILFFAAAGNDGDSRLNHPASDEFVISVGAIDPEGASADFSNFNSKVELAAPGVAVVSTISRASATRDDSGPGVAITVSRLRLSCCRRYARRLAACARRH